MNRSDSPRNEFPSLKNQVYLSKLECLSSRLKTTSAMRLGFKSQAVIEDGASYQFDDTLRKIT